MKRSKPNPTYLRYSALIAALVLAVLTLGGCRSGGSDYARALFEHIPGDPELLVLVRPEDVLKQIDLLSADKDVSRWMTELKIDSAQLEKYRLVTLKLLEETGIPISKVECIGFLLYLKQPVFLLSGTFTKLDVETKLDGLGFRHNDSGQYEYIYSGQKLQVASDGLMIMAAEDMLEDLESLPSEHRLWNRPDFKKYRENSPLDNSIFVWSHPPETLLQGFQYREALGDFSMAINFRDGLAVRATIRINDPSKTVALYNIVFGAVTLGKGLMGDDPDLGPVIQGVTVSQDNREVVANMVISPQQFEQLKDRVKKEASGGSTTTFGKIGSFLDNFK